MKVSDPDSKSYGNHWSPARIRQHFSPSNESIDEVSTWLMSQNPNLNGNHQPTLSNGGSWLNIQLPLSAVEKLLDTKYHVYWHEETRQTHIGNYFFSQQEIVKENYNLIFLVMSR
jgi:tripeptidyl-peptidase-1